MLFSAKYATTIKTPTVAPVKAETAKKINLLAFLEILMATANPISFANLTGELRLAQMISAEINLLLRDTATLRNTPFLRYLGSINGSGSDTIRVRLAGLGRDAMTAAGETATVAARDITVNHADCVVSRQAVAYSISDLSNITQFGQGDLNPFTIAASMAAAFDTRFMAMTCAAASSFSTNAGSNTSVLTVSDFFDAMFNLEKADSNRGNVGPYCAVLASKAFTELQASLRGETANIISNMLPTGEMLSAKGQGYMGSLLGVEIYKSSQVNANGSSGYDNFMIAPGALGYADGTPGTIVGAGDELDVGPVKVEFSRTASDALTYVIGTGYVGVVELEDARGTQLLSAQ